MRLRILLCLCSLVFSATAFSQTLTSTVDRNQLSANQTLKLTVAYDGNTRTDALDLSAVRQDFDVLSTSTGSSVQYINNQSSRVTTWELVLIPKRTGNLVIPSFNLGNIYSDAIQIEVLDRGQAADSDEPMTVELSVDRYQARIGEQVLVRIRLRAQASLADLAGEQLRLDGADVELVDKQDYGEVADGISWRVIEWTYAVFPQSEGSIAIPKQMFTATAPGARRRSFFDSFAAQGQRIASRSESAVINVQGAADATANWFPASEVSVSSSWTSDPANLRVGEPTTRIIEIKAESQIAAAIPPLATLAPSNYKEYRDQPALENTMGQDGITGVRRESAAIVPSTEGPIEFPEQVIRWWDINAKQWREAILPAESYEVAPAVTGQSFSPPQNFETAPVLRSSEVDGLLSQPADSPVATTAPIWKWATIALAVVAIMQAFLLFGMRNAAPLQANINASTGQNLDSEKRVWNDLNQAFQSGDARRIRNQLIAWSRSRWPEESVHSLDSLADKSSSAEFRQALAELDQILFKGAPGPVRVEALKDGLLAMRPSAKSSPEISALAPLYPQSL